MAIARPPTRVRSLTPEPDGHSKDSGGLAEQSKKMQSPVFLSRPTTSGSPPVRSISLSDQSFLPAAFNLSSTDTQGMSLWRLVYFSNRTRTFVRSSSRCLGDSVFVAIGDVEVISSCGFCGEGNATALTT